MRLSVSGDLRAAGASGGCLCGLVRARVRIGQGRKALSDSTNRSTTNSGVLALTQRNNEGSETLSDTIGHMRPSRASPELASPPMPHRQGEGRWQVARVRTATRVRVATNKAPIAISSVTIGVLQTSRVRKRWQEHRWRALKHFS